jgi:adenylate cyclase
MVARESGVPPERSIRYRVGINLGDIVIDEGDIFGDGVNVAARMESMSEPGGVCVSDMVYHNVASKLDVRFRDLGERELKNVDRKIRAWQWSAEAAPSPPAPKGARPQPADRPTVAVLPFTNMSGDPEQEYFSDGITEDLITELARFRELTVLSRNSSFVFKGGSVDIAEAARKLGAKYMVEGSIRKAGGRVRITAQLIDAANDAHVWAERYDRELADIFAVQDDVVRQIAATLVGRLEHHRSARQTSDSLEAYDLYLRAREHFFSWTPADNARARALFEAAIAADPAYAAAYAGLAECQFRDWLNGWSGDVDADFSAFAANAARSVALDDGDSRTQLALGLAYLFARELARGGRHLARAHALNPNDPRVLAYLSRFALLDGDPEQAVAHISEASRLNPFGKYEWYIAQACFAARKYEEAVAAVTSIQNPGAVVAVWEAACEAMAGHEAEARRAAERALSLAGGWPALRAVAESRDWRAFLSARWPFRKPDDLAHVLEALEKAGLPV